MPKYFTSIDNSIPFLLKWLNNFSIFYFGCIFRNFYTIGFKSIIEIGRSLYSVSMYENERLESRFKLKISKRFCRYFTFISNIFIYSNKFQLLTRENI